MSEHIDVGVTAYAVGAGIRAGTRTAVISLRLDQARARQATALARFDAMMTDDARARVARRELREMLGI